jgi:integrase
MKSQLDLARSPISTALGLPIDLPALAERMEEMGRRSKANSTRTAYRLDWEAFNAWCTAAGASSLPASPVAVAMYLEHLYETPPKNRPETKRSISTIMRALAAICDAHEEAGFEPLPSQTKRVKKTMAGLRRTLGIAPKRKTAVIAEHLRDMLSKIPENLLGLRDRALLLVGFNGAFRRSELVGLDVADLEYVKEGLKVHLGRTKTDQEGIGRVVAIPPGSSPSVCPVHALQAWLETTEITNGPVFRAVDRHWTVSEKRLTAPVVALVVKRYASAIGLTTREQLKTIAGHSLRAGLVTSAVKKGKNSHKIMAQTGHQTSKMQDIYTRDAELFEDNAAEGLL